MSGGRAGATFSIRSAGRDDVPLLLRMIRELADYERLADEVVADEDALEESLFGAARCAEAAIGELDGEPVAFAAWFYNFSTFVGRRGMYLEDLYVRPAHRGRGYGLALFRWLASRAVELGCGRMEWAVLDWNEPAIAFYRGLGARPMDEWTIFRLAPDALRRFAKGAPPSDDSGVSRRRRE